MRTFFVRVNVAHARVGASAVTSDGASEVIHCRYMSQTVRQTSKRRGT